MRSPLLLLLGTLAIAPPAEAQLDYYARVGLTGSSHLVEDFIFQPITTTPGIAPTLVAGFSVPLAPRYGVGLEAAYATGGLSATTEDGNQNIDLGNVSTLSALANIDGPVSTALRWRIGVGIINYSGEDAGLFAGGGTLRWLVGGGLDYRFPAFSSWDVMVSGRYDLNRFTTDELRDRGFTRTQSVHRGGLTVGLARSRR